MAKVTGIFGALGISIEAILQKEPEPFVGTNEPIEGELKDVPIVPVILLTHRVREGLIEQAIEQVQTLSAITQPVVRLRVESLS